MSDETRAVLLRIAGILATIGSVLTEVAQELKEMAGDHDTETPSGDAG